MANKNFVVVDKFYGGLSTGSRRGQEGSFRFGVGLNYRTDPDHITANYALVKDTGTVVQNSVQWIVPYQSDIYAYDIAGNIYKKSLGSWTLDRAVSSSFGFGMETYDGYLYYRQTSQIGRKNLGSGVYTDNWKTSGDSVQGLTGTGTHAPIKAFLDFVVFANGRYLAKWDGSTFTYNRLSWPDGYLVRDISIMGEYLAINVLNLNSLQTASKSFIFFWDGTSTTYNFFTEVKCGGPVSAIHGEQESLLIFPYLGGSVYRYDGTTRKLKKIPRVNRSGGHVMPGATTNFEGIVHFGLSQAGTSSDAHDGVYSFGTTDMGIPESLNYEYSPSCGSGSGHTVYVGAIRTIGTDIYVGWKDETAGTQGIDKLSTTTYQTSVTYESLIITTNKPMAVTRQKLFFKPLASGESITLEVKKDQGNWETAGTASYSADGAVTTKLLNYEFRCNDFEFRVTLSGSSTMPSLSKVIFEYEEDNVL